MSFSSSQFASYISTSDDENTSPVNDDGYPSCDLDMEHQKYLHDAHKKRKHEEWCSLQSSQMRFDCRSSEVRAMCLVSEASRLEKMHLTHQRNYCKDLIRRQDLLMQACSQSPPRIRCESDDVHACACLRAPVYRQLPPKYRAMNLLLPHFEFSDLENTVDSLLETYNCDHDMMEDLLNRYGPEEPNVDPHIWLMSIDYRMNTFKSKWNRIGRSVKDEFRYRDNFPTVIRNLSIMRIFLEGSQAQTYSCDVNERSRRDSFHHSILQELSKKGSLFL